MKELTKKYRNGKVTIDAAAFGVDQATLDTEIFNNNAITAAVAALHEREEKSDELLKKLADIYDDIRRDEQLSAREEKILQALGIVIVNGISENAAYMSGAMDEHLECPDEENIFYINQNGIICNYGTECDECPLHSSAVDKANTLTLKREVRPDYYDEDLLVWTVDIDVPHVEFDVTYNMNLCGKGILFRVSDLMEG